WTAPSSDGGAAITGYNVYRGTTSGSETPYQALGNVTGYTDAGVTNGTTYYYTVTAVNSVGESLASNEATATPQAVLTAPGAPASVLAARGNTEVTVSWSAPTNNGGSPITGYTVYRSTTSGGTYVSVGSTDGNTTSYLDTGLTNGTAYWYKVSATNAQGE